MKSESRYFEVSPQLVRADSTTTIKIKPLYDHCRFRKDELYEVKCYPLERFSQVGEYKHQEKMIISPVDGCLYVKQYFKGEQEHIIEISSKVNDRGTLRVHVYSLNEDLYCRRPYKGDLHMHTFHSDGIESPGYVTACCRKVGLDFMAITDHGRYYPSVEAQKKYADIDIDLLICRGEEVHPPQNPVHIINFGGSYSINEMIKNDEETYFNEVKKMEEGINEAMDLDARYQCASSTWCFNKIRDAEGLGIFCHPYWLTENQYYISDTVTSYMYQHQPYDANELIGGYHRNEVDSNKLQVARYNEERANGRKVPIVGVSDAHGCENRDLFGWYYTIVFSPDNNQKDIIDNIKSLYSVAVESMPGETPRAYGPFRLVKYALYLINEVFPMHDELCFEEGQFMLKYLEGDTASGKTLSFLKGQSRRLYDKLWTK